MTINYETLWASLALYGLDAIYAAVLLALGFYLSGVAQRFVTKLMSITHRVDPLVTVFLASLARYAVLAFVGIAVLQLFGIQTASLVAVLGATSLAIGLALQGTLTNLAAGVMLLLFRPFRIGDEVEVAGKAGKVKSLSLFMTELVMPDSNTQILLPNGSVWRSAIINHTTYPGTGEVKVVLPVRGDASTQTISSDLLSALNTDPRVDRASKPAIAVSKIDLSDPAGAKAELTVTAKARPSDVDALKQMLLDRVHERVLHGVKSDADIRLAPNNAE
jgi:small conductance mechanosensitive channel